MRIILLLTLLLVQHSIQAQISGKRTKGDYVLFDSISVSPGDTIYLGKGSDRKGDFVSIYQPENFLLGAEEESLKRSYSGKFFKIKHFKIQKDKRTGEKTVAVVSFGGFNYIADLEQGIDLGEIVKINNIDFSKKKDEKPAASGQISVAEEIAKLKKLYDDGVLTKEEFEAQKKKLLGL